MVYRFNKENFNKNASKNVKEKIKHILDEIENKEVEFDEELKSWIVYVDSEGELLPVGRTINEDLGLFEYCKFNTKEEAIDWINSKPNKMKYDKDLIVG